MRGSTAFLVIAFLGMACFGIPSSSSAQESPVNMSRYWVMHEGRNIEVYGYMNSEGKVVWNPGVAENARPRERRTKSVDGPTERMPTAEIRGGNPRPNATLPPAVTPDWRTNGVNRPTAPAPPVEKYTAHSEEAKRFVAQAVEGPSPGKMHVTIIGNADERARVTNDIKNDPAFAGLRDDLYVQDYDPKDWPVNPALGFQPGKPTIIVQAPKGSNDAKGGRVIYRTLDYSIGPKGLATALRKANPDYKPDLDPGPEKPQGPSIPVRPVLPALKDIDPLYFVLAFLALVVFMPKKGK